MKNIIFLSFIFILPSLAHADITTGLVGYWTMDNADINWTNNTIIDRSGNGNTGTLVGFTQASSGPGKYGQALQFNGTSTEITVANSETLNLSYANAFTYSAWVNVAVFTNNQGVFNCIIGGNNTNQGFFLYNSGGLIRLFPNGSVSQLLDYIPLNATGQWYHVVATYDGTTEKIYLNGALAGNTPSQISTGTVGANSAPVIGSSGNSEFFNGAIDEVRIYNRALSASDVQELYQQTSFSTPPFPVPATPQGLISTSSTANSISLSWNANTEPYLGNYNLYENNGGVSPTTFVNAFPNPPNGQTEPNYGFWNIFNWLQIKQTNPSSNYLDTNGLVIANLNSPAVLSALQAQFTDPAETPGGPTEYQTILDILQNPPNFLIAVIPAGATSFQVTNLTPGTTYSFQLSAVSTAQLASPLSSTLSVSTQAQSSSTVTPEQYLPLLPQPVFKPGYTLPLLSRFGWLLSYNTDIELAASWGYGLEFGNTDAPTVGNLSTPNSSQSMMVAMANNNPSQFQIFAMIPRLSGSQIPASAYDVDANGNITTEFSPQAPDSDLAGMAAGISSNLQQLTSKAPVAVILNGGERFMDVAAFGEPYWEADPTVMAAYTNDSLDWEDYSAQRKAHQEMFFTNAVHALTNAAYIYYPTGNQYRIDTNENGGLIWDWDYKWMNTISDYPGGSYYWLYSNTGWTGHASNSDILSQALNAYGYDSTFGKTLSYNWVNSGYGNDEGGGGTGFGDIQRYYGYLKSYYTAGMIGGVAIYCDYLTGGFDASFNSNSPSNWLLQMVALGQVHAEFSYLEDILRYGTLLPGADVNPLTVEQPAYEFRTGNYDTRVIARKMNGQLRWLISAWGADDVTRTVNVTIPTLGTVTVVATPAGSIYDARIVNGNQLLTMLDGGSENPSPSLQIPTSTPDPDGSGTLVPPLVKFTTDHYTYTAPATIVLSAIPSATNGATITSVAFYNGPTLLGTSTNSPYSYTWTNVAVGNYSLTARAYDSNAATTTSSVWNIIVNASAGNGSLGDVNSAVNSSGQPIVTIEDAELTAQYAIGLTVPNFNIAAAIVSSSTETKPTMYDAYLIAEYAVGLITHFPVQQGQEMQK